MRISSEKSLNFKHPSDSKSDGKSLAYAENDQPFIEGREMKKFSPLYRQVIFFIVFFLARFKADEDTLIANFIHQNLKSAVHEPHNSTLCIH